jgi:hypothetical protein
MAEIVGPPTSVIRNRPITTELRELLDGAAEDTGVEKVVIVSGGQTSNHAAHLAGVVGGWTGSRRHDNGRAADIELVRGGNTLSFTDTNGSQVAGFVTACAARGANGIGAGVNYMGPKRIHVGFGNSPSDLQELVWGAAGASANAPAWLRAAAKEGWDNPVGGSFDPTPPVRTSGRSIVSARGGLWLRRGPGLGFERARLLDEGTALTVLGFDGDWARVDLEGDGRIDGHVFAAFLVAADLGDAAGGVEEPVAEEALAELAGADGAAGAEGGRARRRARAPRAPGRRSEG